MALCPKHDPPTQCEKGASSPGHVAHVMRCTVPCISPRAPRRNRCAAAAAAQVSVDVVHDPGPTDSELPGDLNDTELHSPPI